MLRAIRRTGRRGVRCLAVPFFPEGHTLAGAPRNLSRPTFQAFMQDFLVRFCGLSTYDAELYPTHGIRAGAATSMVIHQVPGPGSCHQGRAGVTSDAWIGAYGRGDLQRRLGCSLALGL